VSQQPLRRFAIRFQPVLELVSLYGGFGPSPGDSIDLAHVETELLKEYLDFPEYREAGRRNAANAGFLVSVDTVMIG
jgi:hypothetical protein